MKTIHVRPGEGRMLIDPVKNRIVPPSGATVVYSPFWKRRLDDGDAVLVPPAQPSKSMSHDARKETES